MVQLFKKIMFFALLWSNSPAFSFPATTRLGYTNCSSCHVSPTGGGALSDYGRMIAGEALSTYSSPEEERIFYGFVGATPFDDYVKFGGDSRYVYIQAGDYRRGFWMQNDLEAAVFLNSHLAVVGSIGSYADYQDYTLESRRNYVLLTLNDYMSVRVGRFFPAYGIMVEDHTTATRSALGFNEGQESYNFELAFKHEYGELFITPMLGSEGNVKMRSEGYVVQGDQKGFAGRAALYLGKSSLAGVSLLALQKLTPGGGYRAAAGAFGILGITEQLYSLLEVDAIKSDDTDTQVVALGQLGYEAVKGLHLLAQYQRYPNEDEIGAKLQWFWRPHFEYAAQYAYRRSGSRTLLLMHYYL